MVVVDLASKRVLELGKGAFEGKSPSSLTFLFRPGAGTGHAGLTPRSSGGESSVLDSPILAVGCSDGIVRCMQLFPVRVSGRLAGRGTATFGGGGARVGEMEGFEELTNTRHI